MKQVSFKSILQPQSSVIAGVATMGLVFATYQLQVGSVAEARATAANHPALESSRRKAGYTALMLVAGLTLITKDSNIGILGGASIIAMELSYRTGIMGEPMSGALMNPRSDYTAYDSAMTMPDQGEPS